ncbi:MAG TPA: cell division ATP-binding protein FtsE [Clostridia bacterium]|jgi:cell division transport system ATP-binding protein|nr:cell division ATP-binding protein FtsE [Clostridia bacterium]HOM34791.1 cell division ATP-binding protein FtsE [Clostridia bacterium]HOT70905.1 cell division ATP-binding protein FtsE [Clostridia bacterium]HPY98683.1 cell division ATP-binding protein FtsE [Clostridia bacterium]HQC68977.1 cell division ATP-binding protein FtsE [Clostridia bacterium]
MIDFDNVSMIYKSGTEALHGVTFHIDPGEFVFITGKSGSGKSTIIKLLMREEKPTSGDIFVNGYDLLSLSRYDLPHYRRRLGVVFQDCRLLMNKTVYQNVEFAMEIVGESNRTIKQVVPRLLHLVDLEGKEKSFPDELAGGEQARVALARAIANAPDILIADEPTGNLDPKTSVEIVDLLYKVNRLGTTVVVVTHDTRIVDRLQQRVIRLQDGEIVSDTEGSIYENEACEY